MKSDVAERLKLLRKSLNLSQKELADKIDIAQTYWSSIETGHRKLPPTILGLLVKEFGLSADWILSGTGQPFTSGDAGPIVTGKMNKVIYEKLKLIDAYYYKLTQIIELTEKAFNKDKSCDQYLDNVQLVLSSLCDFSIDKLSFDEKALIIHRLDEVLAAMAKDFDELFESYCRDIDHPKRRIKFKAPSNVISLISNN